MSRQRSHRRHPLACPPLGLGLPSPTSRPRLRLPPLCSPARPTRRPAGRGRSGNWQTPSPTRNRSLLRRKDRAAERPGSPSGTSSPRAAYAPHTSTTCSRGQAPLLRVLLQHKASAAGLGSAQEFILNVTLGGQISRGRNPVLGQGARAATVS